MTGTVTALRQTATTYGSDGKDMARQIVMEYARQRAPETVLDLWGGGGSARAFRQTMPDAIVTSAEQNAILWPALRLDAQTHGYAHFMGDVSEIEGRYDFIWLDLCGQASRAMHKTLDAIKRRLRPYGAMAITIMPARETDPMLVDDRLFMLPLWLERTTGLYVDVLFPYRRAQNLPMWLVILQDQPDPDPWGRPISRWDTTPQGPTGHSHYDVVVDAMQQEGWEWAGLMTRHHDSRTFALLDLADAYQKSLSDVSGTSAVA